MAKTYTKLVYHIVFSTKERMPLITGEIRERLPRAGMGASSTPD
jgi:hypothetical protein